MGDLEIIHDEETWEELARPGFEVNLIRAGTIYFTEIQSGLNDNDNVICGAKPPENHHLSANIDDRPQTARDIGMVFHTRAVAPDLLRSLREDDTHHQITVAPANSRWKKIVIVSGIVLAMIMIGAIIAGILLLLGDDTGTEPPGQWEIWGGWTQCSNRCRGLQQRRRVCGKESDSCEGQNTEERGCNTYSCLVTDPEGTWTTWQPWEECTQSCGGGTQTRSRQCVSFIDPEITDDTCVGHVSKNRTCNTVPCPDCTRSCETGVLMDCSYCRCEQTVNGQVLSNEYLSLENVVITPWEVPFVELASSNIGGNFTLEAVCIDNWYTFKKDGYVAVDIQLSGSSSIVVLERFVQLRMANIPMRNVIRVTGDRLELCCEAIGVHNPDNYEWMKDGIHVGDDSTLVINQTAPEDTGIYTCRASNDFSAITSPIITVLINDSPDGFCDSTPLSYIQLLPTGCTFSGSNEIDKGSCERTACYGGEINECLAVSTHCCTELTYDSVQIDCGDYSFDMRRITSCGCGICVRSTLTVYGFAGGFDGTPLSNGSIFLNGQLVTNTSMYGDFVLTIDRGISHVSLLIVDSVSNAFLDYSYVFEMPPESAESHFVQANMFTREHEFQFDSQSGGTLEFDSTLLDIPANSFYSSNGQQYNGMVTAAITSIDPVNQEEVSSAPGFNTIDIEGERAQLISYGMFAMVFEDSSGNRLSIPGEITLETSFPLNADASQVHLWTWNPTTGSWEQRGELAPSENDSRRRKRQIRGVSYSGTLRGLTISSVWVNFDAIADETCIVKVRTFSDDSFLERQQLRFSRVFAAFEEEPEDDSSEPRYSLSSVPVDTDSVGNGFCIAIPCSSIRTRSGISREYKGYIFADYRGFQLVPAEFSHNGLANDDINLNTMLDYQIENNKINVRFDQRSLYSSGHFEGPFYNWERKWMYSSSCSNANFDQNHFRFSLEPACLNDLDRNMNMVDGSDIANTILWYDISRNRAPWSFFTCYAKVKAPHGTMIKATSYKADGDHPSFTPNYTRYGSVEDCSIDGEVCIQLRPPGFPGHFANQIVNREEAFTLITIETLDGDYPISAINENISDVLDDAIVGGDTFRFYMESHGYGDSFGIHCYWGDSDPYSVERVARNRCERGNGWAVAFGRVLFRTIDIVLILDTSGSMTGVRERVRSFMESLLEELRLEESNTRIALVTFGGNNVRQWDLLSPIASNPQDILRNLFVSNPSSSSYGPPFENAHDIFNLQEREGANNFILLITDGDVYYSAESVRDMFNEEPVTARIIGINTNEDLYNYDRTFAYTEGPDDQFILSDYTDTDAGEVAFEVANVLQPQT